MRLAPPVGLRDGLRPSARGAARMEDDSRVFVSHIRDGHKLRRGLQRRYVHQREGRESDLADSCRECRVVKECLAITNLQELPYHCLSRTEEMYAKELRHEARPTESVDMDVVCRALARHPMNTYEKMRSQFMAQILTIDRRRFQALRPRRIVGGGSAPRLSRGRFGTACK